MKKSTISRLILCIKNAKVVISRFNRKIAENNSAISKLSYIMQKSLFNKLLIIGFLIFNK